MKNFCIMRVERLENTAIVAHAVRHNTRQYAPENADIERKDQNEMFYETDPSKIPEKLNKRLETVTRKIDPNAVKVVEYLITRSPDAKVDDKKYFQDTMKWLEKEHGKENILNAAAHYDEDTPHLHVLVTPIFNKVNKKGKKVTALSAKELYSNKLAEWQDKFYLNVGAKHQLRRGIKKPVSSKHIPNKDFYRYEAGRITEDIKIGKVPLRKQKEWINDLENKIEASLDRAYAKGVIQGKENFQEMRDSLLMKDQTLKMVFSERDQLVRENDQLKKENDHFRDRLRNPEKWKKIDQQRQFEADQKIAREKEAEKIRKVRSRDRGMGW